jgi:hypothetical protein
MAAGLGFKTFTTGEVLTAADVNGYLMQGVLVFASEAARNSAITSPQEGQFAYTKDTNSLWYYTGSAWVASGATGDIEGVTAGTGISGGGTSGTVTITNSMATAIDAKGDLIVGTGADAFSRLAVGTNGQVLTADSSEATGLKFATPAGGSGMTLLSTTTLSGASVTLNSFSGYNNLQLIIRSFKPATDGADLRLQVNADSGANRHRSQSSVGGAGPVTFNATNWLIAEQQDDTTATGLVVVDIPDYANSATWKAANGYSIMNNAVTVTDFNSQNSAFYYNQTNAITSLVIFPSAGNFTSGTALLYGVK